MYNPAIVVDTHTIVQKLMASQMSEAQAEALAKMHVELIEYQKEQLDRHLEQYREQFSTKADIQRLEDKIDANAKQMDVRFEAIDAKFEAVDGRFEAVDAQIKHLEERLTEKIDKQLLQLTIMLVSISATGVGIIIACLRYMLP